MDKTAAGLLVGTLFAIWWTLIAIERALHKIANTLEQSRQDNIVWRENVWKRDNL
jgi:hypothetical protein